MLCLPLWWVPAPGGDVFRLLPAAVLWALCVCIQHHETVSHVARATGSLHALGTASNDRL